MDLRGGHGSCQCGHAVRQSHSGRQQAEQRFASLWGACRRASLRQQRHCHRIIQSDGSEQPGTRTKNIPLHYLALQEQYRCCCVFASVHHWQLQCVANRMNLQVCASQLLVKCCSDLLPLTSCPPGRPSCPFVYHVFYSLLPVKHSNKRLNQPIHFKVFK